MDKLKVVFKGILNPPLRSAFTAGKPSGVNLEFIEPGAAAGEEIDLIRDADVLVLHKAWYGLPAGQLIEKAEKLRLVQSLSQGTGHLPVRQAADKGIPTGYAGGITGIAIAEHAVMLMLAALKRLRTAMSMVYEGKRAEVDTQHVHRLHDKVVGIIGFGSSGRWVARVVRGFGARVIFYNRSIIPDAVAGEYGASQVDLEELLQRADVVTLHVPLTEKTEGLIGEKQLAMMKPTAVLVNICRGAVVDEPALVRALNEGRIAGAGLDVLTREPAEPDNPLLHMENVVVTPHIAAEVWEDYLLLFDLVWDNVSRLMENRELRNLVTPDTP